MSKTCIFFRTANFDQYNDEYYKIKSDLKNTDIDVWLCVDKDTQPNIKSGNKEDKIYYYDISTMPYLSYVVASGKSKHILNENQEYTILDFSMHYKYDYYWYLEQDLKFTGNWKTVIDIHLTIEKDLLSFSLISNKYLNDKIQILEVDKNNMDCYYNNHNLCGYIPISLSAWLGICRFSKKALETLHFEYKRGICGFSENIVPIVLYYKGCSIDVIDKSLNKKTYCKMPGGHADMREIPENYFVHPAKTFIK